MKITQTVEIFNCGECSHFSPGFMAEPNECGWFKEPYEHLIKGKGIPHWCPIA